MLLLKFDVAELQKADEILGPLCFCLFIIFAVFICLNIFISIVTDNFRVVRNKLLLAHNEDIETLAFMMRKFKRWIGACFVHPLLKRQVLVLFEL